MERDGDAREPRARAELQHRRALLLQVLGRHDEERLREHVRAVPDVAALSQPALLLHEQLRRADLELDKVRVDELEVVLVLLGLEPDAVVDDALPLAVDVALRFDEPLLDGAGRRGRRRRRRGAELAEEDARRDGHVLLAGPRGDGRGRLLVADVVELAAVEAGLVVVDAQHLGHRRLAVLVPDLHEDGAHLPPVRPAHGCPQMSSTP